MQMNELQIPVIGESEMEDVANWMSNSVDKTNEELAENSGARFVYIGRTRLITNNLFGVTVTYTIPLEAHEERVYFFMKYLDGKIKNTAITRTTVFQNGFVLNDIRDYGDWKITLKHGEFTNLS